MRVRKWYERIQKAATSLSRWGSPDAPLTKVAMAAVLSTYHVTVLSRFAFFNTQCVMMCDGDGLVYVCWGSSVELMGSEWGPMG